MALNLLLSIALIVAAAATASAQTEVQAEITPPTEAPVEQPAEAVALDPAAEAKRIEVMRATVFAEKYFALGDYASALEQYSRADAILPNHPAVLFNTALILSRVGRLAEAQTKIDSYLQLYPTGAEIGQVQRLRIDLDFERELQQKQQESQSYVELFNRARFTFDKGDVVGARKLFEEAAQQRPDDAAAVFNQAVAFESLGEYAQATERLRRYQALAPATDKAAVDKRIFALEAEIADREANHVCPFCGAKLAKSAIWCPHCWHGPYDIEAARFTTRACGTGASATRTVLYSNDRVHQNEDLSCTVPESPRELLRFSSARRRAIQQARQDEGWTYDDGRLVSYRARDANVLRLVHGDSLEKLINLSTGDVLTYSGRKAGDKWLLENEQVLIEGQKFDKTYTYDDAGRIASEIVRYQNGLGCGHLIQTTATYHYEGSQLTSVSLVSGYTGFKLEGQPQVEWKGTMRFAYDEQGRVTSEEFTLDSHTKTWAKRAFRPLREQLNTVYPSVRLRKPVDIMRPGDVCGVAGTKLIGNQIDLRPFYSIAPDLAIMLPLGTSKIMVKLTYPENFTIQAAKQGD